MKQSYIKNPRIVEATKSSGHKYWIEHPQNDAILAAADTLKEAKEIINKINQITK